MTDAKKPVGRQKGGIARSASLTPQARKAIAQRAAAARWGKPLRATHKGNFKEHFGADVECYVLDDSMHTPVLSQRGMGIALGLAPSGGALRRLIESKGVKGALGADLTQKLENPLSFQAETRGARQRHVADSFAYDAALLIDLCRAILEADRAGKLKANQKAVAGQAAIIIGASAKSGIRGLVYALAGYNPTADEVIEAFKAYVQEEARKYEKEFPQELYLAWHRLYNIPVLERGRSWHFKHLTVRHIYYPLAKSNGKILELLRALKAHGGDGKKKLFQFLNDVGARALRMQIGRVLEMAEDSTELHQYEGRIAARFGGQQELDLVIPPQPAPAPEVAEAI
jgi:hypothetical protein